MIGPEFGFPDSEKLGLTLANCPGDGGDEGGAPAGAPSGGGGVSIILLRLC